MKPIRLSRYLEYPRVHVLYIALLSVLCLLLDYVTGPEVEFPILIIIPISLSAWYNGFGQALAVSFATVAVSALFHYRWGTHGGIVNSLFNTAIRFFVFGYLSLILARLSRMMKNLRREVRVLEGFLPICSHCKKIRSGGDEWHAMEEYIADHSEARFSHSICPECAKKYYGEDIDGGG